MLDRNTMSRITLCNQGESARYLNPSSINVPPGYTVEVFVEGLDSPSSILFTDDGQILITDTGYITGNPYVARLVNNQVEVIANGFNVPLIGINYLDGNIYVSHMGAITIVRPDGTKQDIITGLPSYGDFSNSRVAFGQDNKMYFGQGTATNSGVVGLDNLWVKDYPFFHDNSGNYIMLNGQNFQTNNMLIPTSTEQVLTGAYSPYGEPNLPFEVRKATVRATGSILRANLDGSELELVAWGLRSPSYVQFDSSNRLFSTNNGYNIRGSRPIANAPDEFHLISPNMWYGWPDFAGGEPVTSPRYKPEGGIQPEFLLSNHPNIPPRPFASFPPGAVIAGFDFNQNINFGPVGDIYIAEFGAVSINGVGEPLPQYTGIGHRVSKIDIITGTVTTFAINRSGFPSSITREGGFGRPSDVTFGPDGAMYVVDMGNNTLENPNIFIPDTGVIWRISREN